MAPANGIVAHRRRWPVACIQLAEHVGKARHGGSAIVAETRPRDQGAAASDISSDIVSATGVKQRANRRKRTKALGSERKLAGIGARWLETLPIAARF